MAAVLEKSDYMEVTISTDKGIGVRINPEDMGRAQGLAVEIPRGETVSVKRVLGNMLIANKQAVQGKVELDKKGK